MSAPTQPYEQVSARTVRLTVSMAPSPASTTPPQSLSVPFNEVKQLLSGKPLRRPNRNKPVG